jgi:fructokinase
MFLVCGEALWDMFAVEGENGLSFDARIGGSPFNVAMGLSRLGQVSALLTGLSTDRLGERLFGALKQESVDPRYLVRTSLASTIGLVDVGPDGGPVYSFYGTADREVRESDLPTLGEDVWGIHAGSFALVVEPVGSSLLTLFQREAGRRLITLDPNVRLNVEPDVALWRDRIAAFVAHADLVKVSDEDLELLYPDAAPADIARNWLQSGAGLVIVTRGPAGAEAFGAFGRIEAPGRKIVVADTVGAGDTFQAALIAGLAESGAIRGDQLRALDSEAVRALVSFAIRAAAITCTRRGANLPRREELETSSPEAV